MLVRDMLGPVPSMSVRNMSKTAAESGQAERGHLPDCLRHDRAAHLRAALLAIDEVDRDLDDAKPREGRPVGRLDLERVPLARDRLEVDRLQYLTPVALEAARQVTDRRTEQHTRVEGPTCGDEPAQDAPVPDRPAVDVARAEHE